MSKKERIDVFIFNNKYAESREMAKRLIMAGQVLVNDEVIDKPGHKIDTENIRSIRVKQSEKYVSRGGLKLENIIKNNNIEVNNMVCLDVGSSTGGFTDCLLQFGAKKVYALDVGTNQLHWKMRNNPRVKSIENTNYRFVERSLFESNIDLIVTDVSFISIKQIIKKSIEIFPGTTFIGLIKPQFEVGPKNLIKGIVKDKKLELKAVDDVINFMKEYNCKIINVEKSPIKGQKGNQEYLVYGILGRDKNE
jgi:23S rRNA (cytidine1920-2'-O)/16S rRNA (cytidine1409-2'-O)-methyltransferase